MTLRITELQDRNGLITYALPRAMVRFTSSNNTINVTNSYNIRGITWLAEGVFSVVFTTGTMPDANYVVQYWVGGSAGGRDSTYVIHQSTTDGVETAPQAAGFNVAVFDNGENDFDPAAEHYIVCFR